MTLGTVLSAPLSLHAPCCCSICPLCSASFVCRRRCAVPFSVRSKFMPAGALSGVGLTAGIYHGLKYREWKH
jgi:hypothetical protein